MPRQKDDYTWGSSLKATFLYWINERHSIYHKRFELGESGPWTDDEILQTYRFTNVFRQLDKGTIALCDMLQGCREPRLIIFNIFWYRMFNRYEHATDVGLKTDYASLESRMIYLDAIDTKMFTSAHMTVGKAGESKLITTLRTLEEVWDALQNAGLAEALLACDTLQKAFELLKRINFFGVGPFINYEIVSDLRWHLWERTPDDVYYWANIGPGCKRGLERLGLQPTMRSLIDLHTYVRENCSALVSRHFNMTKPYFELREIEHSLCEFDKYERVRTGAGRPREKFHAR